MCHFLFARTLHEIRKDLVKDASCLITVEEAAPTESLCKAMIDPCDHLISLQDTCLGYLFRLTVILVSKAAVVSYHTFFLPKAEKLQKSHSDLNSKFL